MAKAVPVGPVIYSIKVNGVPIKDKPLDVELRQAWGEHDLFFIRIEYFRNKTDLNIMKLWKDNAPVEIVWGRRPANIATWYGYVNHHKVDDNADSGSKALQITYVCTGTSKPMNTDKSRRWGEVTPTYLAKKIAHEYGMRAVLTKSDWVLPYEVQGNESDFSFLKRIANKVGYRFWVSGGTLYYIDPAAVLDSASKVAVPQYRMDKLYTKQDTMREFRLHEGGNLPGATISQRSLYGLDKHTGNIFHVKAMPDQSPILDEITSEHYVTSLNEGHRRINAWQGLSQWWISATAELFGTTLVYPGKMILLQGLQMPVDTQGYWIVGAVTHVLKSSYTTYSVADRYISRVEILRNTGGTIPKIKNAAKITPEFTTCKLQQNLWVSANQAVIYDGVTR